MKNIQLVCVFALFAVAACVPVDKKTGNKDTDVVILPLDSQPDLFDIDGGVVDTGFPGGYFYNPFGNPFSGFWQSMEETMRRLREQMSQVLNRLPAEGQNWKDTADKKGNTTSTTKIINGHKVTVNETVYADDGDNNSGTFFKIRIVDVRPTSEEAGDSAEEKPKDKIDVTTKDIEETTPRNANESVEKGSPEIDETANEIPRVHPESLKLFESGEETFGEDMPFLLPDEAQNIFSSPEYMGSSELDLAAPIKEIETNDVNFKPIDLSNDILVNQMLADAGYEKNPDAEEFSLNQANLDPYKYQIVQDNAF